MGMGTRHNLLGASRGKTVEDLVQIHDETMQAVMRPAGHGGKLCDIGFGERLLLEAARCLDGAKAIFRGLACAWVSGIRRLDHRLHIGQQRFAQPGKARRPDHAMRGLARARDEGPHGDGVDTGLTALGGEIGGWAIGITGMRRGGLQHA
jgi:hypothetical protein